jgi:glutamate dehydrogenase
MDYIGVLCFDEAGNAVAEQRFLGLYTSSAYNRRPWDIPLVRQRHAAVMSASGPGRWQPQRQGAAPHPGDAAARRAVPVRRGGADADRDGHPRPAGARAHAPVLRKDRHGRFYSALAYIPRDRFSPEVRERIESMLMRELKGDRLDTSVQIGESPLAQLHLLIRPRPGESVIVDPALLEAELVHIVRNWHDQLRDQPGAAARRGAGHPPGQPLRQGAAGRLRRIDLARAGRHRRRRGRRARRRRRPAPLALPRRRRPALQADARRAARSRSPTRCRCSRNLGLRINSEHPYAIELDDGPRGDPGLRGRAAVRHRRRGRLAPALRGRLRAVWRGEPRTTPSTTWCCWQAWIGGKWRCCVVTASSCCRQA